MIAFLVGFFFSNKVLMRKLQQEIDKSLEREAEYESMYTLVCEMLKSKPNNSSMPHGANKVKVEAMNEVEREIYNDICSAIWGWPEVAVTHVGRCVVVTITVLTGPSCDLHALRMAAAAVIDARGFIPVVTVTL